MRLEDIAYIAGFFDGEGCAWVSMPKSSDGVRRPKLTAKITQNDRAVLDWIRDELGYGNVLRKTDKRLAEQRGHEYVTAYRAARCFLTLIEPHLRVKKQHVTQLLDQCGREQVQVA